MRNPIYYWDMILGRKVDQLFGSSQSFGTVLGTYTPCERFQSTKTFELTYKQKHAEITKTYQGNRTKSLYLVFSFTHNAWYRSRKEVSRFADWHIFLKIYILCKLVSFQKCIADPYINVQLDPTSVLKVKWDFGYRNPFFWKLIFYGWIFGNEKNLCRIVSSRI